MFSFFFYFGHQITNARSFCPSGFSVIQQLPAWFGNFCPRDSGPMVRHKCMCHTKKILFATTDNFQCKLKVAVVYPRNFNEETSLRISLSSIVKKRPDPFVLDTKVNGKHREIGIPVLKGMLYDECL